MWRSGMKRKFTVLLVALLVAGVSLFAASASELYQNFSDAISNGDVNLAIDCYTQLQEQTGKEIQKAQRSYEKALQAGNVQRAINARNDYYGISRYTMSEEDTDALLSLILKEAVNDVGCITLPHRSEIKGHSLPGEIHGKILLIKLYLSVVKKRQHRLNLTLLRNSRALGSHAPEQRERPDCGIEHTIRSVRHINGF